MNMAPLAGRIGWRLARWVVASLASKETPSDSTATWLLWAGLICGLVTLAPGTLLTVLAAGLLGGGL